MQRLGFIHDMMDVKVLILYVAARSQFPMTVQELYEVCYQDDCLSYFDVCTAIPELVRSGHLFEAETDRFQITDKGRRNGELTADSIAFSVKQRAEDAVDAFNRQMRRCKFVQTEIRCEDATHWVLAKLNDEFGPLMTMELTAPDQRQALRLQKLMEQKAEEIYSLAMTALLDEEDVP
ncbi:MAG: DUF4364 family protein [Ruminococcaceae bacterium]|nr:DUF4364 family protein [Oscillospiraceae bacterium]MBQ3214815.1 DUF4364 family protein [Oscillospiraceae bacterium]